MKHYLRVSDPGKIFFTSDTHFGHARIVDYCSRPFPGGVEEMDKALVDRWNEVVPEDGIVFHLGDFAFLGARRYRELLASLHGQVKILVPGNHDHRTLKRDAWTEVIPQMVLKIEGWDVYLSHFPFRQRPTSSSIQLHGHIHSGPGSIMTVPGILDVGVDGHDFRPWRWGEIKEVIEGYTHYSFVGISISRLSKEYPGFLWVPGCHELCGWNPTSGVWIVIEDGLCVSEGGTWVVTRYQLSPKDDPIGKGYKYGGEKILSQDRVKLVW